MTELLFPLGKQVAVLRGKVERTEYLRKKEFTVRWKYWRKKLGGARGTAVDAELNANEDIDSHLLAEIEAKESYFLAKELLERADQELNSISSRIKALLKNSEA